MLKITHDELKDRIERYFKYEISAIDSNYLTDYVYKTFVRNGSYLRAVIQALDRVSNDKVKLFHFINEVFFDATKEDKAHILARLSKSFNMWKDYDVSDFITESDLNKFRLLE